jgi:hypothetical protein
MEAQRLHRGGQARAFGIDYFKIIYSAGLSCFLWQATFVSEREIHTDTWAQ